jgi:hypothetical protein
MLLPAGVMAIDGVPKAGDLRDNTATEEIEFRMPRDLTSQAAPEVLPAGIKLNGEIIDGDVIPLADSFTIEGGTIVSEPCAQNQTPYPQVQGGISIYSVTDGIEVIMYETSFEDNFDIYNNWVQIDEDCGLIGGHYDSWSWSDARASDGDHSMKSTMYDIYKGNQDDYLEMRNCIDMSGQDRVKIEFDVWVEGQDNQDNAFVPYEFYDYVSFEVYDDGVWWTVFPIHFSDTTLPLYAPRWGWDITDFVEEIGNGWWHVTFDVSNGWFFDDTCVKIRFDWHSDPQFQYEGGYVDNVKLISVEGERDKIWQTHLQECTEIDCHIDWTMFPLEWTPPGPGDYEIVYWMETENCPTAEFYDSTFPKPGVIIPFTLGDNYDCEITDLIVEDSFTHAIVPPEGQMNEGADAHIIFEYHQGGNLIGENIPVELSVYKKTWEVLVESDMSSNMAFDGANSQEYSLTTYDYWVGPKSLAFWNEDLKQIDDGTFGFVVFAQKIDFEAAEEVILNYYAKWELPAGAYARPFLYDPDNFYLLAAGYVVNVEPENQMEGSQPFWIGPEQPAGRYTDFSLTGCYEWYKAAGFFRDYSGNLQDKVGFGFYLSDPADGVVFSDNNHEWSGLFIDEVVVTGLVVGEEVFSDSMIIPGPVEPCETVTAQFEWEDVPFSRYRICVETVCEDDIDSDNNEMCQQIIVMDPLERIDKPEGTDNTNGCSGEWGICGSDTDNYLSSNPDSEYYAVDSIFSVYYDGCIDADGTAPILIEFDAWGDLEDGWDYVYLQVADECPPDQEIDWAEVEVFGYQSDDVWDNALTWAYLVGLTYIDDGWWHYVFDISSFVTDDVYTLRFVMDSDVSWAERGFLIDDFFATGMEEVDTMDDMDNWYSDCNYMGDYWDTSALPYCIFVPDLAIDDSLVWATEIEDAYEAWMTIEVDYSMNSLWPYGAPFDEHGFQADIEISADGGSTWYLLDTFFNETAIETLVFDITPWAGNEILIKFTVHWVGNPGNAPFAVFPSWFCIDDAWIAGKQDNTAPVSTVTMSGTMKESGWYTTAVQVSISATDVGAGMGEIHYIVDGSETVVAGDQATFTVSGNGEHNIEFWAVDSMGNEEVHHTIPAFRIDSGSPPSVAITAPEPGLYLFGNKLLSASKVIIIGAFTVEATASDAESGIYRVQFYLDGDLISEDTEVPFSAYVAEKHMGAGTIRVVAEDYAQNTAEDTLDITYYKFL